MANETLKATEAERTYEGFRRVTKGEFFASVGQMDVTPYPQGRWSDEIGYLMEWKLRGGAGEVVGLSDDYSGGRYWVRSGR